MTKFFPNNPLSRQYLRSDLDHTSDATVDWVSGAAVAMKRSVFQRLGGFSKLFFLYFEDVDLCKRAKSLGIPTHFCGNVIVVHQIGGSSASSTKALFYRHASMWKYYKLYLKVPVLDPLVFAAIAARFVLQAAVTITRRLKKATGGQLSVSKLAPYGVPLPSPGLARMVVQEPKEKRLDLAE
jgi:GT2 family glycosyltransferase